MYELNELENSFDEYCSELQFNVKFKYRKNKIILLKKHNLNPKI